MLLNHQMWQPKLLQSIDDLDIVMHPPQIVVELLFSDILQRSHEEPELPDHDLLLDSCVICTSLLSPHLPDYVVARHLVVVLEDQLLVGAVEFGVVAEVQSNLIQ